MKGPAKENELAKRSTEMNGRLPSQYDNKDYGIKRTPKLHKFSVKDTKNNKLYWTPAIAECNTFKQFLVLEHVDSKQLEKITSLPQTIISELKKLISQGAKDLSQDWEDALELVNTAYHISNIRHPNPDQRGAWKQYEELLRFGVHVLADTRGLSSKWRAADVMYAEHARHHTNNTLYEQKNSHRFFVIIPNAMDVEVDASDLSEVIRELTNKIRRHGARVDVVHRTQEGAVLNILRNNEPVEEIIIKAVS
jgi:hypothetical protein